MVAKSFRKKPVVIEAVQWSGTNVLEVYSFMHGAPTLDSAVAQDKWFDFENIHTGKDWHIKTPEDGPNGEAKHVASVGDWIIKGVQGEFYPCKPDIFDVTYEPAETPPPKDNVVGLPQDVINLVIAAREAFDSWTLPECESKALDKALEPFAERVPYENEPAATTEGSDR